MTMIHHQPPETPLSRRQHRNSAGSDGIVGAGAVGMPTLFSPRKRTSATSSADEYSGTTLTMTNDESEASDINDFDAFGLLSPVKKPPSYEAFSPFDVSTANFDTVANFFATENHQQRQQGSGSNDTFGSFRVLSQAAKGTAIHPLLDEDASLNDDDADDGCFSPKPLSRKPSSSSPRGVLLDSRPNSTHGTSFTTSSRSPPSQSNSGSSRVGRRASRSHHARPDEDELEHYKAAGNEEQRPSRGDTKSQSPSRKGSSRKITTSSRKLKDEQPSATKTKRSSTKSSQRSHSVGRRASTGGKLNGTTSSGTKHRKSTKDIPTLPSSGNETEKVDQREVSRGGDGRPNLEQSLSYSDRKANRKSITKSDHNPQEETQDPKIRTHRGRVSEPNDASLSTKRRSHSESRRTARSTRMSGTNIHHHHHQRCPSTSNPSDLDQTTTYPNNQGRLFRRSAASIEIAMAKKDEADLLLSSPVSKECSSRHERTVRSVGRFHSDVGKGVHHEGRRPSRRLLASEATRTGVHDGDEMMLSPGSKDGGSHSGRRSEGFMSPQGSSSFGLAFPPEDTNASVESARPRGSTRACRRSILKEDLFASPRPTDSKAIGNRRLGGSSHSSTLANATDTSGLAAGFGDLLGSPVLSKKSPASGSSSKRPVLDWSPPTQSHSDSSAMRKRDFDPRLNNLLQKLRDPSRRDLNPEKDAGDDDDATAQGIPVNQRGVFTRIAPLRHKSFNDF